MGATPRRTPSATYHREYSYVDGSTEVRKGKKRTHKPFGPIEFIRSK